MENDKTLTMKDTKILNNFIWRLQRHLNFFKKYLLHQSFLCHRPNFLSPERFILNFTTPCNCFRSWKGTKRKGKLIWERPIRFSLYLPNDRIELFKLSTEKTVDTIANCFALHR